jgi:hypothetical protein
LSVGSLLILTNLARVATLFRVSIALDGAVEIAVITMVGSMYFASRYAQSSGDEILSSQGQDLANLKRTIIQTLVNFIFIAPIMALVFSMSLIGAGLILNRAGDTIAKREDL